MSYSGPGAKWSWEERQEVLRLRGEGVSIRQIALQVFGSEALRGRVERILKSRGESAGGGASGLLLTDVELEALDPEELWRFMVERAWAALARRPHGPSPRELKTMLEVERRLAAREFVERKQRKRRSDGGVGYASGG